MIQHCCFHLLVIYEYGDTDSSTEVRTCWYTYLSLSLVSRSYENSCNIRLIQVQYVQLRVESSSTMVQILHDCAFPHHCCMSDKYHVMSANYVCSPTFFSLFGTAVQSILPFTRIIYSSRTVVDRRLHTSTGNRCCTTVEGERERRTR